MYNNKQNYNPSLTRSLYFGTSVGKTSEASRKEYFQNPYISRDSSSSF